MTVANLKYLSAYCCVSKVTGYPLRGHDGEVESDLTRLKRGVRYGNNLNSHEAYYRALVHFGVLDKFREKFSAHGYCEYPMLVGKFDQTIKNYERMAKRERDSAASASSFEEANKFHKRADDYLSIAEAYRILEKVSKYADTALDKVRMNKAGNVDWKDLTCVQFYKYDAATNSFVEVTEKGQP